MEDVAAFRRRARSWIEVNVPRLGDTAPARDSAERTVRARALQRRIYDAGFAGITWPKEYGGQELTPAHLRAFAEELSGYENPYLTLSVSLGVIGPTLLEHGTAEQKASHLPALLRGDTLWVQYLSEPSGGSDMAGVLTRATRDGGGWLLNGSKVWTTFGDHADYALCLARTDWDVPKHAGLSMFIVPVHAPGVTVVPLPQSSGSSEFCQEYLEDVRLAGDHLLGAEGEGWALASALLVHERNALGGGSAYFAMGSHGTDDARTDRELVDLAARTGRAADPLARQAVAEVHAATIVGEQLAARVATGIRTGVLTGAAGSMLKLYSAELHLRRSEVRLDLAGPAAVAWGDDDGAAGAVAMGWLTRQGTSIMGGTNEIQRNIISERVLGLPREHAPDKNVPFSQVRTNTA
ncbi:MAG TPA: acyl-CoA dehydrogenase family protein [Amycolatopsis sp.]|nr:acyl-CoA dehydrogenase family protein [Amycolatopsis sp.]